MSERQGMEIDYCPKCRGVWLDRGELDKIIERSAASEAEMAQARTAPSQADLRDTYSDRNGGRGDDHYDRGHGRGHHGGRRRSFLREIFD